jgi:hypothetical protein
MITRLRHGLYEIDSERGGRTYVMDPRAGTCTCPHWQHRLKDAAGDRECKHLKRLRLQIARELATARVVGAVAGNEKAARSE